MEKQNYTIDPETGNRFCYYKLLGIEPSEQDATKIRKAYLRACVKYHPDRNEDKEYADVMFKYLQEAYTTINTPQERAYYDRNRAKILNLTPVEDEFAATMTLLNFAHYRSPACYTAMDDSERGFYTVYRNFFQELNAEERRSAAA